MNVILRKYVNHLKSGLRDRKASTAVEFALVAAPLMMLIFGCLELALVTVTTVQMDDATQKAAREIRMGILTSSNSTSTTFRQSICDKMSVMASDCMNNLRINVKTYANFAAITADEMKPPVEDGKFKEANFNYSLGGSAKIQLVSAYYSYSLITPVLNSGMMTLGNGNAVLSSQAVFRNEPF